MSSEFKKGQLVAVSDTGAEGSWHLRVYSHTSQSGQHYCRNLELPNGPAGWWNHVVPAEDAWPGVFLFSDRIIIEACQKKDIAYVKTIENLCRRLVWLSEQLQAIGDRNGTQECPPSPYHDCRRGSCAECWEVASLKAVEDADGVEISCTYGQKLEQLAEALSFFCIAGLCPAKAGGFECPFHERLCDKIEVEHWVKAVRLEDVNAREKAPCMGR